MLTMRQIRDNLVANAIGLAVVLALGALATFCWAGIAAATFTGATPGSAWAGWFMLCVPLRWWWMALQAGIVGALMFASVRLRRVPPDAALASAMAVCLTLVLAAVALLAVMWNMYGAPAAGHSTMIGILLLPPVAALVATTVCVAAYAVSRLRILLILLLLLPTACLAVQIRLGLAVDAWRASFEDWYIFEHTFGFIAAAAAPAVGWWVGEAVHALTAARRRKSRQGLVRWLLGLKSVIEPGPRAWLLLIVWSLAAGAQCAFAAPFGFFGVSSPEIDVGLD